jgi:hypothetical protein
MMATTPSQHQVIKFGIFEVDLAAGEVRKAGVRQKLAGQPFQVLQALLERPQEIVTREELRERLWPGNTFVEEGGQPGAGGIGRLGGKSAFYRDGAAKGLSVYRAVEWRTCSIDARFVRQ